MVFQNPVLWPHMTVSNSINFVLSAKKTKRKERAERVSEIIKAFNLYPIRNHHPNKLSGGEKKKVSLAIAIAAKARFLLLDEPFENIDEEQQEEILSILLELFNTQKIEGMLCVTHNPSVADTLGESVYYLRDGKLNEMNEDNKGCKMDDVG
jgi:ABC-type sulfate/molybdate transport systems ATPase subunit